MEKKQQSQKQGPTQKPQQQKQSPTPNKNSSQKKG